MGTTPPFGPSRSPTSSKNAWPAPHLARTASPPPKPYGCTPSSSTAPRSAAGRFKMAMHIRAPPKRPHAPVRRWQRSQIGELWQLDASPHRWFPLCSLDFPMLNMLDDCSRLFVGSKIYDRELLLSYLDFLPDRFPELRPPPANLRRLSRHLFLAKSRRADPTRLRRSSSTTLVSFMLQRPKPKAKSSANTNSGRADSPLFRQRTHRRDRNRQPPRRRFATPSQRPRNPPRTAHDPATGLGTRQKRKTLRPAPSPALPLVALCLEPTHDAQGRLRWPRSHRHPAPPRRTSPGRQR